MKAGASASHDRSGSLLLTGMPLPSVRLGSRAPSYRKQELARSERHCEFDVTASRPTSLIGISWLVGGPCGDTLSGCVTCRFLMKTCPRACSGVAVLAEHGPQRLPKPGRSSVAQRRREVPLGLGVPALCLPVYLPAVVGERDDVASPVLFRGPARDDPLVLERVEERDHRGAVDAQHGRGFLL